MDNLPTHKVAGVTEAIEAADAMAIYLHAYSPDLNPIEQVFSKLKALLRKAAERTIPGLWRRIRSILRTVSKKECLNEAVGSPSSLRTRRGHKSSASQACCGSPESCVGSGTCKKPKP
jgi:DDE superfamily endonuclease